MVAGRMPIAITSSAKSQLSLVSASGTADAIELGACEIANIKPGRVGGYLDDVAWRVLAAVDAVAARHKTTNAIVALAWLLAQPTVAAPIASASRVSQVEGLLAAVQLKLTREDLAELDTASRR